MLRTARRAEPEPSAVRGLAATLFLAGVGRVLAWSTVGKPHPFQRALLAFELTLPPLFVAEQARLGSTPPEARP